MPNHLLSGARLTGALLLVLGLSPMVLAQDEAATEDEVADAAPATEEEAAPADPSVLDSEILPRAPRSLLLDMVHNNAGYFLVGERGHVLTSDDGAQWTQLKVPTRSTLTSIASVDGLLWAAGHDGVIIQSNDGGQTWMRRRASPWNPDIMDPSEGVPVMDLLFTDASQGFAVGAYSLMLVTEDGGATWTPRDIIDRDAVEDEAPDDAAPAEDDWTFDAADLQLDAEADPHFNAITSAGPGQLVIVGERGAFFRSRDGGQTWERKRLPYEGSMFGVLSWGEGHLLAFGLRGNVLESRNLGETWTAVETGVGTSLMGGVALADGGALLVGANGVVLHRPDAASPFTATSFSTATGETPALSGVLPAEDGAFVVIGDKGVDLYRTK